VGKSLEELDVLRVGLDSHICFFHDSFPTGRSDWRTETESA